MLGGQKPERVGLEAEDNYTIEVWDREDGTLIGVALRTSLWSVLCEAWREVIEAYPGRFLLQKNGRFVVGSASVPAATDADVTGWYPSRQIVLQDLPEWYGLVARCSCGNIKHLDRFGPPLAKLKGQYLTTIEEKLSCRDCTRAGRSGSRMELGLYKLPR